MPQVLKEEIRARILDAALEAFAELGFAGATMSDIAARAGLGAASLYRYYASKEGLFDAVVPDALAARFEALLDRRVAALGRGDPDDLADEMLGFWLSHRLAVVILLDRAEGTRHARYGRRFVEHLVKATLAQTGRVGAPQRFVLEQIFENTRVMLAAILRRHSAERDIRAAIAAFWVYQVSGLRALSATLPGG